MKLEIKKIGNSTGLILPKELLARLGLKQGDEVIVTEAPDGFKVSSVTADLERGMEIARKAMKTYRAALTELGERIGVAELRDLGALVRLVEHDGARVRLTLSARAATMRRRELADAEGKAAERDVSMRLAQLVVCAGFMVFLAYPAIVNVMSF